jgi:hypothetical protein
LRQDLSSVADIARPRVNDADEIMLGLEQSIAVTATNCYVSDDSSDAKSINSAGGGSITAGWVSTVGGVDGNGCPKNASRCPKNTSQTILQL